MHGGDGRDTEVHGGDGRDTEVNGVDIHTLSKAFSINLAILQVAETWSPSVPASRYSRCLLCVLDSRSATSFATVNM